MWYLVWKTSVPSCVETHPVAHVYTKFFIGRVWSYRENPYYRAIDLLIFIIPDDKIIIFTWWQSNGNLHIYGTDTMRKLVFERHVPITSIGESCITEHALINDELEIVIIPFESFGIICSYIVFNLDNNTLLISICFMIPIKVSFRAICGRSYLYQAFSICCLWYVYYCRYYVGLIFGLRSDCFGRITKDKVYGHMNVRHESILVDCGFDSYLILIY